MENFTDLQPLFDNIGPSRPLIVAGPCSAETREQVLASAEGVARAGANAFRAGIWKPRTHPGGFEGVGSEGLEWLVEARKITGLHVGTEVATRKHVEQAAQAGLDFVWLGARTTASPFAVQEIADAMADTDTRMSVLVKNPVNPDIELWIGALQRIHMAGVRRLGAVHRGFSAYGESTYRNAPIWRIALELGRRIPHLPILCDPSHIGGNATLIAPLSEQAIAMGFDGLMIETHISPEKALSDANQQITPIELDELISTLDKTKVNNKTSSVSSETDPLIRLRSQIDRLDESVLELLSQRMQLTEQIALYKRCNNMPVVQKQRYHFIMNDRVATAQRVGLDPDFARQLMASVHEESVKRQLTIYNQPHLRACSTINPKNNTSPNLEKQP